MVKFSVIFFAFLALAHIALSSKSKLRLRQNADGSAPGTNTSDPTKVEAAVSAETEVKPTDDPHKVEVNKAAYCYVNDDGVVYDLNPLRNENVDYRIDNAEGSFNFNFCQNAIHECHNNKIGGMAFFTRKGTEDCSSLAGPYKNFSRVGVIHDDAKGKTTLKMVLPLGEKCKSNNKEEYRTTFILECDEKATSPIITSNFVTSLQCDNMVNIKTKAACPVFSAFSMYRAIQENRYVFGIILIILGIFFCFFGQKFYFIAQMVAGGVAVTLFFIWLVFNNANIEYASWAFWLTIVLSAAAGAIVMFFLGKFEVLSRALFGALLGFVGGLFLYNLFIRFIPSNPAVVFWITIVVCIGIGIGLGIWIGKPIIVIATAVIGAYGIIRGISFMAGGFPDEKQVYELGQKGEWEQMKDLLTGWVYLYLAGFLVLAAIGMFIQFKYFYEKDEDKKPENEENKAAGEDGKPLVDN